MLDDNVPGSEKIDIKQALENYNDAIYYRKKFFVERFICLTEINERGE